MPTLDHHLIVYGSSYDTYSTKAMPVEKADLWKRKLAKFSDQSIDKAFDELFSTQKYAFALSEVLNCARKHETGRKPTNVNSDHLPPVNKQGIKDLNQVIKAEADYKAGRIIWDEFELIGLPFANKVYDECKNTGIAIFDRFKELKDMVIMKKEEKTVELMDRGVQFDSLFEEVSEIRVEPTPEQPFIEPEKAIEDESSKDLEW